MDLEYLRGSLTIRPRPGEAFTVSSLTDMHRRCAMLGIPDRAVITGIHFLAEPPQRTAEYAPITQTEATIHWAIPIIPPAPPAPAPAPAPAEAGDPPTREFPPGLMREPETQLPPRIVPIAPSREATS